jgi:8-oxo-dGTP diphosphatase
MAHINELYDYTASGYLVHQDKILLVRHKKIGKWLQPGGHIELDEDPLQGLYRELEEETGLTARDLIIVDAAEHSRPPSSMETTKLLPIPFDFNVHEISKEHKHIDFGYLIKSTSNVVRLETEGAVDIKWFTKKALEQKLATNEIFSHTYQYACLAIELIASR